MYIQRIYKNSSDDVIRIDKITMIPTTSNTSLIMSDPTKPIRITYQRNIETELVIEDSTSRIVYTIVLDTDADTYDTSVSGPANFEWAEWSAYGVRCNMTDLPQIGDTI